MDAKDIMEISLRILTMIMIEGICQYFVTNKENMQTNKIIENAYAADILSLITKRGTMGTGDWEVISHAFFKVNNLDKKLRTIATENRINLIKNGGKLEFTQFNFGKEETETEFYREMYGFLRSLDAKYWNWSNNTRMSTWCNRTLGHGIFSLKEDVNRDNFAVALPNLNNIVRVMNAVFGKLQFLLKENGTYAKMSNQANATEVNISDFICAKKEGEKVEIFKLYDGFERKKNGLLLNIDSGDKEPVENIIEMFKDISALLTIQDKTGKKVLLDISIESTNELYGDAIYRSDYDAIEKKKYGELYYNNTFGSYFTGVLKEDQTGVLEKDHGLFWLETESGMGRSSFLKYVENICNGDCKEGEKEKTAEMFAQKLKEQNVVFINVFIDIINAADKKCIYGFFNEVMCKLHWGGSEDITKLLRYAEDYLKREAQGENEKSCLEGYLGEEIIRNYKERVKNDNVNSEEKKAILERLVIIDYIKRMQEGLNKKKGIEKIVIVFDGVEKLNNDILATWASVGEHLPSGVYLVMLSDLRHTDRVKHFFTSAICKCIRYNNEEYGKFVSTFVNKKFDNPKWIDFLEKNPEKNLAYLNLLSNISNVVALPNEAKPKSRSEYYEYYFRVLNDIHKEYAKKIKNILFALAVSGGRLTIDEIAYLALGEIKATFELWGMLIDISGFVRQEKTDLGIVYVLEERWFECITKDEAYNDYCKALVTKLQAMVKNTSVLCSGGTGAASRYIIRDTSIEKSKEASFDNEFLLVVTCLKMLKDKNKNIDDKAFAVPDEQGKDKFVYLSRLFDLYKNIIYENMLEYKTLQLKKGMLLLIEFLFEKEFGEENSESRYDGELDYKFVYILYIVAFICDQKRLPKFEKLICYYEQNQYDDIDDDVYICNRAAVFNSSLSLMSNWIDEQQYLTGNNSELNKIIQSIIDCIEKTACQDMYTIRGRFDKVFTNSAKAYRSYIYFNLYSNLISQYEKGELANIIEAGFKDLAELDIVEYINSIDLLEKTYKNPMTVYNISTQLIDIFNYAYEYFDRTLQYDSRNQIGENIVCMLKRRRFYGRNKILVSVAKDALERNKSERYILIKEYIQDQIRSNENVQQEYMVKMLMNALRYEMCEVNLDMWRKTGEANYLKEAKDIIGQAYKVAREMQEKTKEDLDFLFRTIKMKKILVDAYSNDFKNAIQNIEWLHTEVSRNVKLNESFYTVGILFLERVKEYETVFDNWKKSNQPDFIETLINNLLEKRISDSVDKWQYISDKYGIDAKQYGELCLDKSRIQANMDWGMLEKAKHIVDERIKMIQDNNNNSLLWWRIYLDYKILGIRILAKLNETESVRKDVEALWAEQERLKEMTKHHKDILKEYQAALIEQGKDNFISKVIKKMRVKLGW